MISPMLSAETTSSWTATDYNTSMEPKGFTVSTAVMPSAPYAQEIAARTEQY